MSGSGQGQDWRHALAGCTAGLATVLALQPLDVIKTRLQVQDGSPSALPAYSGLGDAVRTMVRTEGWRALYAGVVPALIGSGVSWSLYFCAYNNAKRRYARQRHHAASIAGGSGSRGGAAAVGKGGEGGGEPLPAAYHLISAIEAGSLVCLVTNPIWVVKTRLQLQRTQSLHTRVPAPPPLAQGGAAAAAGGSGRMAAAMPSGGASSRYAPYSGFVDAVRSIHRQEGWGGFYKGIGPSLLLVSHGAIQFAVYEELKGAASRGYYRNGWRAALPSWTPTTTTTTTSSSNAARTLPGAGRRQQGGPGVSARQPTSTEITVIGALSKLAASLVTYPFQVVRARLQRRQESARALRYVNAWHVVRVTLRREGVRGLYKGLAPNMLRVMPQSAMTFLVYESMLRGLNNLSKQQQLQTQQQQQQQRR